MYRQLNSSLNNHPNPDSVSTLINLLKNNNDNTQQLNLNKSNMSMDPFDQVYYNVEITNNTSLPKPAVFTETLTQPIITKCEDYYLSIVRFSVPGNAIPIFVCDIVPNQSNPNLTPYSVTLSYNGSDYTQNIIYFSLQNVNAPLNAIPVQQNSQYYYVYQYNHMIQMINIALDSAFTALKTANPGAPPTQAPFFVFDENTQLISLVAQNLYSSTIASAATISIYANTFLVDRFLSGMLTRSFGYGNANGKDVLFLFPPSTTIPTTSGNVTMLPNYSDSYATTLANPQVTQPFEQRYYTSTLNYPPLYLFNTQGYNTLNNWFSLKKIVFISGTLPVNPEYVKTLNTNSSAGNVAKSSILTDFEPILNSSGASRSLFQYFPQGPYRLISMLGTNDLTNMDISIYWQDIHDVIYPLYILPGQISTIKILFQKKSF